MRRVKKFVSLAAMLSLALAPMLASGCAQDSSTATTGGTSTSTTGTAKATEVKKPAGSKKNAKKPPKDSAESGSDRGAGVKPPVK
jgi:hypothetical protein